MASLAAAAVAVAEPFRFLDLIIELREYIYDIHLKINDKPIDLYEHSVELVVARPVAGVNLLRVCRQIYKEIRKMPAKRTVRVWALDREFRSLLHRPLRLDVYPPLPVRHIMYMNGTFVNNPPHEIPAFHYYDFSETIATLELNLGFWHRPRRALVPDDQHKPLPQDDCERLARKVHMIFPKLKEIRFIVYGNERMSILQKLGVEDDEKFPHLLADLVRSIPEGVKVILSDKCPFSDKVTVPRKRLEKIFEYAMQEVKTMNGTSGAVWGAEVVDMDL